MRGATKAAAIILAVLCVLLSSCELPGPWVTVFSDDFNRADSDNVGNGWGELPPVGDPPQLEKISGSALQMTGGSSSPYYAAITRTIYLEGDFRVTFDFSFPDPSAPTRALLYVATADMDADSGWYALGFIPGSLGIWKAIEALPGGVNPSLDASHPFTLEILHAGAAFTVVLTDTATSDQWTATSMDDTWQKFTTIHLKAGWYDSTAISVLIDDFVLQTR